MKRSEGTQHTCDKGVSDVTAAILAGGLGTRLRPVVADRPKVLAEVRGHPFLTYLLDHLADAGIRRVVLCTGYKGDLIRAMFGDSYGELDLVYSQESEPLGTGGALRLALPFFESDPVLVMNGDSLCRVDLGAFLARHRACGAKATIVLSKVSETGQYGLVQIDHEGRITSFDEKRQAQSPGWVNAGLYLISRRLFETIPDEGAVSLEHQVVPGWVGHELYGYASNVSFLDIGTPEAYAMAQERMGAGQGENGCAGVAIRTADETRRRKEASRGE